MATSGNHSSAVSLTTLAAICGVCAGVGGLIHAVGEISQGSGPTGGLVFNSWAHGRIASNLGGEPAMSLLPDLLVSGILTAVASVAVVAWAAIYAGRRYGGAVLVLLSVVMLLVGGGFAPPLVGILASVVAAAAHSRQAGTLPFGRAGRLLAAAWPALFWLTALNVGFLVVGSLVVAVAVDLAVPDVFVASLFLAVLTLPLAAMAGVAHQARQPYRGSRPQVASGVQPRQG